MNTDSPIEAKFWEAMQDQIIASVMVNPQMPIQTRGGNYRVDFSILQSGVSRVIECDGKDFHEYEPDQIRDINMLRSGTVDEVYRFRGCDIHHSSESCVSLLRALAPDLFDASAKPTTAAEKLELAMLLEGDGAFKPIVRFTAQMTLGLSRTITKSKTASLIDTGDRGACILQVKSPYWKQPATTSSGRMEFSL